MSDGIFTSAARREAGEEIKFTLDGEDYLFTPPKTVPVFLAADKNPAEWARVRLNWLSHGLPEDQAQRIHDRLMDFDDALDYGTLSEVINYLMEEMSGRPTGPSSD